MKKTDTGLGSRIKQSRKKAGLTQEKLAKRLGIAYPTLNKYENNHRVPTAELLSRLSKILKSDPGWLLTGEGSLNTGDKEIDEIITILKHDIPEAKEFVLKILKGQKKVKDGVQGIQNIGVS